ncbi:MAG: ATP synthase F1 subunit delta [Anaerolineae bacterium]|jgi:F-type H+-transporting ATPase subunit delta
MKDRELAVSYSRAVFEAAVQSWAEDLIALRDNLRVESSARATLGDENVPFETRKTLVDRMLPPSAPSQLRNLVYSLVGEGRLSLLDDIIVELRRFVRYGPDVKVAEVTSAVPLDDEAKAAVEKRLVARFGEPLDVSWRVDPRLIGGLVIQVGDELIDDSVLTRLETLRQTLQESL